MDMKDDKSPREKQWEDRVDLAKDKAKLEQHKVEQKADDVNSDMKEDWKHTKNVAKEKMTEAKNSIDETAQKAKHRWDEKLGK